MVAGHLITRNSEVDMQFGRIHGIALAILGIALLGIQTMQYMMPTGVINGPTRVSQTAHHAVIPLFGIFGLLSLLVGVAIVATANRRDEPDRKNAVK
jgi:uncharacterized protein YhhL (DUF1145 family)